MTASAQPPANPVGQPETQDAGSSPASAQGAVVCATGHDWPTLFCQESCVLAEQLLATRYSVLAFPDLDTRYTDLYVELYDWLHSSGQNPRPRLVAAYFSTHGDLGEQGLIDGRGRLFFERRTAQLFDGAVFILAVCLHRGTFAETLLRDLPQSVRAILGYKPHLLIPSIKRWQQVDPAVRNAFQRRFLDALVQPLRSLTGDPNCTIAQARNETLRAWGAIGRDPTFPLHLQVLAFQNALTLTLFGDADATL